MKLGKNWKIILSVCILFLIICFGLISVNYSIKINNKKEENSNDLIKEENKDNIIDDVEDSKEDSDLEEKDDVSSDDFSNSDTNYQETPNDSFTNIDNGNNVSNKQDTIKDSNNETNVNPDNSDNQQTENKTIDLEKIEFDNSLEYVPIKTLNSSNFSDFQKVNFYPNDATNKELEWSSSDPSIISIESGKMKLNNFGTVTITATSEDGNCSASYTVKVVGHLDISTGVAESFDAQGVALKISFYSYQQVRYPRWEKRFFVKGKFYLDNVLLDEKELIPDDNEGFLYVFYKTSECINGEYHMEYTVVDQLSGYEVNGKVPPYKIVCPLVKGNDI